MVDTTTTAATAETHASTEAAHGGAESHAKPKALGMDATMWVALAMLVVIGLAVWKKVPAVVTGALDKQIAAIKEQLDKATALRAEAEAIKAEYLAKARQAERDTENLPAPNIQIEVLVHHLLAKLVAKAAYTDGELLFLRHAQPISVKNTAKNASSTITMKMPSTTACVVRRPTCSLSPSTCMP